MSDIKTPQEQITYANMLYYGNIAGLALMVLTFALYVTGILEPHVPLQKLMHLWSGTAGTYLHEGNVPHGWGWTALLGTGDFVNFLGIALLAGMTIVAYIPLVPAFLKKGEKIMALIALGEVLVLIFAASGIVGGGAH
ncbi:hypothetical protein [Megalodesulfovibrio gigas]|uniref:DUF1634 domain-containing protein n=1 Tax=Megalodesulfovibrio gigas (strain ATCC 19364 / DSM 1382 / NCIMB 9332 / VKM B-1759) TaxID=1121448 RepID=T2G780_MEGG1|nr:hypothetical protein [Megalodesulfovibrio gigas]AGW12455.1 hypothetical protein DGI_0547 [Megalodesulfovibrio gigas DSM 1382 = ATCC 19364]